MCLSFTIILSSSKSNKSSISIVGYYDDPSISGVQQVQTDCSLAGGPLCKIQVGPNFYQLYTTPQLDSIPGNQNKLRKVN